MEPTTDAILIFEEGNRFSVFARMSERCVLSYGNRREKNKNNIVEYYNNDNNNDDEDNKNRNRTARVSL